jgi:hypothetical protein
MSEATFLRGKFIFIMGGGKFGKKALRYFKSKGAKVLVVDIDPNCKAKSEVDIRAEKLDVYDDLVDGQTAILEGDAFNIILTLLETKVPDLVVTAIPGNCLAKIVDLWFKKKNIKIEPDQNAISKALDNLPKNLITFVNNDSGIIVISYMFSNMQCRDNCLPPKKICALTGRPKIVPINEFLDFCVYDIAEFSKILVSKQITGGLGAIIGKDLNNLLKKLDTLNKSITIAIGIACHCHGIINFLRIRN